MDVFVAFDIETTGTDVHNDHITEIAAYKFARQGDKWVEIGRFQTLVNPGGPIPAQVLDKIPITDEMVHFAPDELTAVRAFNAFVGDAMFVGHNCSFDLKFVSHLVPSLAGRTMMDTYWLSKVLLPGKAHYTLVDLIKDQGLSRFHTNPHRAWSDARATAALFAGLVRGAELLPAADLSALRAARGSSNPMWSLFLSQVVRGNGVGAPKPPAPDVPADNPLEWWKDEARMRAPAPEPSPAARRWHLGDRIRRSWVQGLTGASSPAASPPSSGMGIAL